MNKLSEIHIRHNFKTIGKTERALQRKIIEIFDDHLSTLIIPGQKLKLIGEEISVGYENRNNRKIDLLALNNLGQPVIIELKRSKDIDHELQALRYGLLFQNFVRTDIYELFRNFKNKFYQINNLSEKPNDKSMDLELDNFLINSEFEKSKPKFSIILLSEKFDKEVLFLCNQFNQLNYCQAYCYEINPIGNSEILFKPISHCDNLLKSASNKIKKSNHIVLSTEDILINIKESNLRDLFRNLIQKYPSFWQPNNKRLSIKGLINKDGLQINWRITQTTDQLHFRQINTIDGDNDLVKLRSMGFNNVSYSKNKKNINALITTFISLKKFVSANNL